MHNEFYLSIFDVDIVDSILHDDTVIRYSRVYEYVWSVRGFSYNAELVLMLKLAYCNCEYDGRVYE